MCVCARARLLVNASVVSAGELLHIFQPSLLLCCRYFFYEQRENYSCAVTSLCQGKVES